MPFRVDQTLAGDVATITVTGTGTGTGTGTDGKHYTIHKRKPGDPHKVLESEDFDCHGITPLGWIAHDGAQSIVHVVYTSKRNGIGSDRHHRCMESAAEITQLFVDAGFALTPPLTPQTPLSIAGEVGRLLLQLVRI